MSKLSTFLPDEKIRIQEYLAATYSGVFSAKSLESHYWNHVELEFANYTTQVISPRLSPGASVLDIGSGFGSCVLAARSAGFDARGIELSEFEVDCARKRLSRERPEDIPEDTYFQGDARYLNFSDRSFDAITLWNVLEHIENCRLLLKNVAQLLKPGGIVFIICPNYNAWRQEAHYHVPWKPSFLLPKEKAADYLKSLGHDASYFETSIHYRTNREVIGILREYGFEIRELGTFENREINIMRLPSIFFNPIKYFNFYNPFRHSVEVAARKL